MRLSRIIACVALVALLAGCRNSASDGQQASSTFYNAGNRQPATEDLMEVKIPSGVSNRRIDYEAMTVYFNPKYHIPNCVAYELTATEIAQTDAPDAQKRNNYTFNADPKVSG